MITEQQLLEQISELIVEYRQCSGSSFGVYLDLDRDAVKGEIMFADSSDGIFRSQGSGILIIERDQDFTVITERGPMRIAAASLHDAREIAIKDGHRVL